MFETSETKVNSSPGTHERPCHAVDQRPHPIWSKVKAKKKASLEQEHIPNIRAGLCVAKTFLQFHCQKWLTIRGWGLPNFSVVLSSCKFHPQETIILHVLLTPRNHHSTFCLCDLTVLRASYKRDHTVFVMWLVYFIWCNVLKVHPCCSLCQNAPSFFTFSNVPLSV